jgi:hypothetical protein
MGESCAMMAMQANAGHAPMKQRIVQACAVGMHLFAGPSGPVNPSCIPLRLGALVLLAGPCHRACRAVDQAQSPTPYSCVINARGAGLDARTTQSRANRGASPAFKPQNPGNGLVFALYHTKMFHVKHFGMIGSH